MTDDLTNDLMSWENLKTRCDWSGLLVGNGFSQNIWRKFAYPSLYDIASKEEGAYLTDQDKSLFERFRTRNFEAVLSALATSKAVANALGQDQDVLKERERSIRAALIKAVHAIHIPWLDIEEEIFDLVCSELLQYSSVYSTNYDLLIYWSMMRDLDEFRDYLWGQEFDIADTEVWGKKTKVHFLHGGLHLYRRPNGQTLKRQATGNRNLLDLFATPFKGAVPLFISEGSAQEKLASIYRSDYLSFVFSCLANDYEPMVIFGHALGDSDQHIVDAIGRHRGRDVAISIRSGGSIRKRKAEIIKALPDVRVHFFDAATHPLGSPDLRIEEGPQ